MDEAEDICFKGLADEFHGGLTGLDAVVGANAGVVDEDIEAAELGGDGLGGGLDAGGRGHVEGEKVGLRPDGGSGGLALGLFAGAEEDGVAEGGELAGGFEAEAFVGAGDER